MFFSWLSFMNNDIIVYVSAGGQSTRLYPLTLELTKAWLDIGNKTPLSVALRYIASKIPSLDIFILTQDFVNNVFIPVELKDGINTVNTKVHYVNFYDHRKIPEKRTITEGSGEGFINFLETYGKEIGERLILTMNVDNLANFDPNDMAKFHRNVHNGPGVTIGVTYWNKPNISQFGTVKFDETGKVIEFREKSSQPASDYINTGIVMFSPGIIEYLRGKSLELKDLGGHVIPYLVENGISVYAYGQQGRIDNWVDFGTIQAYLQANGDVLLGRYPWFDYEGYESIDEVLVHKNSIETVRAAIKERRLKIQGPAIIGSNLALYGKEQITIGNAVIGHNVKLGDGAIIIGQEINGSLYPTVVLDASSVFASEITSAIVGYSSMVSGNGKRSILEPYSVVGNNIALSSVNLREGIRVATRENMERILETHKYDVVYSDGRLVFFAESSSSYNPFK